MIKTDKIKWVEGLLIDAMEAEWNAKKREDGAIRLLALGHGGLASDAHQIALGWRRVGIVFRELVEAIEK